MLATGFYMVTFFYMRNKFCKEEKVINDNAPVVEKKTSGVYEGAVVIRYRDALNEEAKIQKHLEDI